MEYEKVFAMPFGKAYDCLVKKAERKGKTKEEVDALIIWQTGYAAEQIAGAAEAGTPYGDFFHQAPNPNLKRMNVGGSICGVKVQEIENATMREIRILDKLVDELAKGKTVEKIIAKF